MHQKIAVAMLAISIFGGLVKIAHSQEGRFVGIEPRVSTLLSQRIHLDLRDVTLLEAIFAIRDQAKLNIVVGNDVVGRDTNANVNASFSDTEVHQVLDSLLIPRGYSYRVVSGSLVILPVANVGERLPNFVSATLQLKSNKAIDILPIVTSMLSPEGKAHSIATSNSILVLDYSDRIEEIKHQIDTLEQVASDQSSIVEGSTTGGENTDSTVPVVPSNEVRVFRPQFVPVDVLVEGLSPLLTQNGKISSLPQEDKLVISDTPENLMILERALSELDMPRRQVRIWARIYDCGLEDIKACGVNFAAGVNGTSMSADGDPTQSIMLGTVTAPVANPTNGTITVGTINRMGSLSSVIQALETGKDTRLLADPNVIVMNHEEALIEIVTEVPFQQLTQGGIVGSFGTTAFREAGVKMLVTPHIAEDNTVSLLINPRFSVLTGFTDGEQQAPIIDRREAKTTVRVENLQTLVLGGLRQRTRTVEQSGIPGLRNIPYAGWLFRWERQTARESELLVFITPELVCYDHGGTQREACTDHTLIEELDLTPTYPLPFGKEAMRAEQAARNHAIDHRFHKKKHSADSYMSAVEGDCQPPTIIGGYDSHASGM